MSRRSTRHVVIGGLAIAYGVILGLFWGSVIQGVAGIRERLPGLGLAALAITVLLVVATGPGSRPTPPATGPVSGPRAATTELSLPPAPRVRDRESINLLANNSFERLPVTEWVPRSWRKNVVQSNLQPG